MLTKGAGAETQQGLWGLFGFRVAFVSVSFCLLFHFETSCYL